MALPMPFESSTAQELNIQNFKKIYHAAVGASCGMAEQYDPCCTFQGSLASEGKLQLDLSGVTPMGLWEWEGLEEQVVSVELAHGNYQDFVGMCM